MVGPRVEVTGRRVPVRCTTRAAEMAPGRRFPAAAAPACEGGQRGRGASSRRRSGPLRWCGTTTENYQRVSPGSFSVPLEDASEDCRLCAGRWCGRPPLGSANQGRQAQLPAASMVRPLVPMLAHMSCVKTRESPPLSSFLEKYRHFLRTRVPKLLEVNPCNLNRW